MVASLALLASTPLMTIMPAATAKLVSTVRMPLPLVTCASPGLTQTRVAQYAPCVLQALPLVKALRRVSNARQASTPRMWACLRV